MNGLKQISGNGFYQLFPSGFPSLPASNEKEIHLRNYWKVLEKRRWIIIASFAMVLIAAALVTFTKQPVYRGTITVQINKENPQILDFKEIFSVNTMDLDYYQTQYKILENPSLADRVIKTLKLHEHPEFIRISQTNGNKGKPNVLASLLARPSGRERSQNEKEILLINRFLKQLKIEPIRNSRLVKIHFNSHYPELAMKVPNTLGATYIQDNLDSRFVATQQAKEWLTGQLDDLKAKVERSDEALQAFGLRHDIVSLEEKENVTMQRLTELNDGLTKTESERMSKEALYRQTKDRNSDALPAVLENRLVMDLRQDYIQLEAQYTKLSETYKPEYPEMVRLRSQMQSIQRRIDAEIGKIVTSIKNDYEYSLRKEALLRQAFEQQKARVMAMQEKAIQYNILKREADTNKELYKGLLQRMKEAGVSAGITASNIQIIDPARLPISPFKPNKKFDLLLAGVLGLFLGIGLAFFIEYLDNTVKTPEEVEQLIQLPSFGTVPEISYERKKRLERRASSPVELITYGHPKSILSEAYRNIRTSVLLSFSGKPPKRIAVTSPNPGEGKTTTALNTAIALSQNGAQVLIIDADMRRPRVHQIFDVDNETGLSTFLSGNGTLESIIRETYVPNLHCVPSGPIPPNPSELIGSNPFKEMMEALSEQFDHIIIDSPPVLGLADSTILSTFLDGILLVVLGGKTPRETLLRAKEVLSQVNAKILGVVINRVEIHRSDYGYSYYRSHHYYGKEEKKKRFLLTSSPEESALT